MLQQADVDRLTALTQFKEVKAPFDGTIVQRQIDIGNLVTAGSTANTTSLYHLSENSPMRIYRLRAAERRAATHEAGHGRGDHQHGPARSAS